MFITNQVSSQKLLFNLNEVFHDRFKHIGCTGVVGVIHHEVEDQAPEGRKVDEQLAIGRDVAQQEDHDEHGGVGKRDE